MVFGESCERYSNLFSQSARESEPCVASWPGSPSGWDASDLLMDALD